MPIDRFEIGGRRRDLHEVVRRAVKGAAAADAEIRARGPDQRLGLRLDHAGWRRRRDGGDLLRQVLALVGVEDGEALQERNRLCFVAALAGPFAFIIGYEAVGVDDGDAARSLPDIAAKAKRLAECEPALAGKTVLDNRAPEDQDIDPGIAPAGRCILRHGQRRLRCRGAPGLDPGNPAGLQLGDDLAGDVVIEVRPVGAGTGMGGLSGHRGSPRRAPGATLPILNPSRQTRPHSHSRCAEGHERAKPVAAAR